MLLYLRAEKIKQDSREAEGCFAHIKKMFEELVDYRYIYTQSYQTCPVHAKLWAGYIMLDLLGIVWTDLIGCVTYEQLMLVCYIV